MTGLYKLLRLLWSRLGVRQGALLAFLGEGLATAADLAGVFAHVLLGLLVVGVVLLTVFLAWSGHILARSNPEDFERWVQSGRTKHEASDPVPHRLRFLLHGSWFLAFTLLLALVPFAAEQSSVTEPGGPQGFYARLVPALGAMQASLAGIHGDLGEIRGELRNVKRETSGDPRKELANLGVAWTGDAFLTAVQTGDDRTVRLFLAGGMRAPSAQSQGRPLPVMLSLNRDDPGAMLDLLVAGGLDPNREYSLAGPLGAVTTTLLGSAIDRGNEPLVRALLRHHVALDHGIQTFGAMGAPRSTYPLVSAVLWKQYAIAGLLLDAGANPAVGDNAAFREASGQMALLGSAGAPSDLRALAARLEPRGAAGDRTRTELRLQQVESALSNVALESLRAPPGSSERASCDSRYNALQAERRQLLRQLGRSN